jgi:hypothetical protein
LYLQCALTCPYPAGTDYQCPDQHPGLLASQIDFIFFSCKQVLVKKSNRAVTDTTSPDQFFKKYVLCQKSDDLIAVPLSLTSLRRQSYSIGMCCFTLQLGNTYLHFRIHTHHAAMQQHHAKPTPFIAMTSRPVKRCSRPLDPEGTCLRGRRWADTTADGPIPNLLVARGIGR